MSQSRTPGVGSIRWGSRQASVSGVKTRGNQAQRRKKDLSVQMFQEVRHEGRGEAMAEMGEHRPDLPLRGDSLSSCGLCSPQTGSSCQPLRDGPRPLRAQGRALLGGLCLVAELEWGPGHSDVRQDIVLGPSRSRVFSSRLVQTLSGLPFNVTMLSAQPCFPLLLFIGTDVSQTFCPRSPTPFSHMLPGNAVCHRRRLTRRPI